jgi:hypothetical protein
MFGLNGRGFMSVELPSMGLAFWPVGNGDSVTIRVSEEVVLQVDLNHCEGAGEDDDPRARVIDELASQLPEKDDKPYLSAFALTHPDQDHCRGFQRMLDEYEIGELWGTPRVFREYKKVLCNDAVAFRDEMDRRREATIEAGGDPGSGDRLRVIGSRSLLDDGDFVGFPESMLAEPGDVLTTVDGQDFVSEFAVFIHSPHEDYDPGDRNNTSLGMQVTLKGLSEIQALLFGDLSYSGLRGVFDRGDDESLRWHVLLAPHHCSKSVMYSKGEGESEETLKPDIMDALDRTAHDAGWVVASSNKIPESNQDGDDPPHIIAKERYEETAPSGLVCTMEHPNEGTPEGVIFDVSGDAVELRGFEARGNQVSSDGLSAAIAASRGSDDPPPDHVGFGGL